LILTLTSCEELPGVFWKPADFLMRPWQDPNSP
jgi:hypothetical protein